MLQSEISTYPRLTEMMTRGQQDCISSLRPAHMAVDSPLLDMMSRGLMSHTRLSTSVQNLRPVKQHDVGDRNDALEYIDVSLLLDVSNPIFNPNNHCNRHVLTASYAPKVALSFIRVFS
jgi:hypothetical protein